MTLSAMWGDRVACTRASPLGYVYMTMAYWALVSITTARWTITSSSCGAHPVPTR
jgi:hypothetical protein